MIPRRHGSTGRSGPRAPPAAAAHHGARRPRRAASPGPDHLENPAAAAPPRRLLPDARAQSQSVNGYGNVIDMFASAPHFNARLMLFSVRERNMVRHITPDQLRARCLEVTRAPAWIVEYGHSDQPRRSAKVEAWLRRRRVPHFRMDPAFLAQQSDATPHYTVFTHGSRTDPSACPPTRWWTWCAPSRMTIHHRSPEAAKTGSEEEGTGTAKESQASTDGCGDGKCDTTSAECTNRRRADYSTEIFVRNKTSGGESRVAKTKNRRPRSRLCKT